MRRWIKITVIWLYMHGYVRAGLVARVFATFDLRGH
jgi:hypothetical protein